MMLNFSGLLLLTLSARSYVTLAFEGSSSLGRQVQKHQSNEWQLSSLSGGLERDGLHRFQG